MGILVFDIREVTHLHLNKYESRCVTKTLLLWLLTMAPACARLDLLEMTLPELSSPPLLDVPATRVSWSVWDRRMPMLEMRPSPREVSLPSSTPLSMESSPTGMIWRRSGTTPSTMNSVLPLRNNPSSSLRLPLTPRLTVRRLAGEEELMKQEMAEAEEFKF